MISIVTAGTWSTGLVTRYFSRKALGDMSYMMVVARWDRIVSIVCRGCCRVTRRYLHHHCHHCHPHHNHYHYFCRGLAMLGKMDWAAS